MAQHPSLRSSSKNKQHRSVLKRFEKIELLKKKDLWKEGENSAFGLPKVKVIRFKIKKEKGAPEAAEAQAAQPGAAEATTEQKPQAKAQASEQKEQKQKEQKKKPEGRK